MGSRKTLRLLRDFRGMRSVRRELNQDLGLEKNQRRDIGVLILQGINDKKKCDCL